MSGWGLASVTLPELEEVAPARGLLDRAQAVAAELNANPGLTDDPEHGRPQLFTEKVGEHAVKALRAQLAEVKQQEDDVMAETEAALREPDLTPVSAIQRHELLLLAQTFGQLSQERKLAQLERAVGGRDPLLASALARTHPMITGLGEPVVQLLREQEQGARVDPAVRAKLKAKAEKVSAVRRGIEAVLTAIEDASNRARLKTAGLASLRRGDMTDKQKSDFITQHGLSAFKALRP